MSLLNVPYRPFPRVLSSPSSPSSRLSASTTSIARSRRNSPSALARWSASCRMADSAPNTGYEPKLANIFSYVDPEHTPIIFPVSHHDFQSPDDATVIPTSPEGLPSPRVSSSRKHTAAAGRLMRGPSSLWKQGACHVSSRSGPQKSGAELDREFVAAAISSSQSKGKERSRHKRCAFVERQRQSPKNP